MLLKPNLDGLLTHKYNWTTIYNSINSIIYCFYHAVPLVLRVEDLPAGFWMKKSSSVSLATPMAVVGGFLKFRRVLDVEAMGVETFWVVCTNPSRRCTGVSSRDGVAASPNWISGMS
jgi:hypothetical protein